MRQQAVQAVGPSSSYGGAYRQSGTFAPVGDIGETEPEPGRSPVHHPGAHTEGTAVVDLLAAYGGSDNSADPGDTHGRRRRRS